MAPRSVIGASAIVAAMTTAPTRPDLCIALATESGVPSRIQLLPAGRFQGRDGAEWINDRPDNVVAAFDANQAPLVIDYEHATDVKGNQGEPAPAAGWINRLVNHAGEIWADVEWTEKAASMIAAREYRFISPVFYHFKDLPRVTDIIHAGLTNTPRLVMTALSKNPDHDPNPQETSMEKQTRIALCKALGLADEASDAAILAAVEKSRTDTTTALARAETPDMAKFVPRADFDKVKGELETATASLAGAEDGKIEAAVDQAIADGKVAPASKDFYVTSCKAQGLGAFEALISTSAKLAEGGELDGKDPGKGGAPVLTADEKSMAKQLGLKEDDYAKDLALARGQSA